MKLMVGRKSNAGIRLKEINQNAIVSLTILRQIINKTTFFEKQNMEQQLEIELLARDQT